MADYNSSLPVRTESAGDVIAKLADSVTPSQQVEIDASRRLSVKVNDALPAGTNNIGDVDVLTEPATAADGAGALPAVLKVIAGWDGTNVKAIATDSSGNVNANIATALPAGNNNIGDVDVASIIPGTGATNLGKAEDAAHASGDVGVMALAVRQDAAGALAGTSGDYAPIQVDAIGNVKMALMDAAGAPYGTGTNPFTVTVSETAGDPVHSYDTQAALAGGGNDNHDYTVTAGKTLLVKQILASGSGKMKIEIQEEDTAGGGTFTTKAVLFNSTANPNMYFMPVQPLEVEAGKIIRVIRTNRDNQAQDVYSTIIGVEV